MDMNHSRELRVHMKAAFAETSDPAGGHLSEDEMIAFCQERMAETERDRTRPHILQCGQCLQLFKSVNDFFEPRREDEVEVGELEVRRAWKEFWPQAQDI